MRNSTETIKESKRVAFESSNKGEFYTGTIKKVNSSRSKALVMFEKRGLSRWCNVSNLLTLS